MKIAIAVRGVQELLTAFTRFGRAAAVPRPGLEQALFKVIQPQLAKRFDARGPGWAPLSPNYAAWKAKRFPGRPLLVLTGAMRQALLGGIGSTFTATDNSLTLNQRALPPYWKYHQLGAGKLPARKIFEFDASDQAAIGKQLEAWLTNEARAAGFGGAV